MFIYLYLMVFIIPFKGPPGGGQGAPGPQGPKGPRGLYFIKSTINKISFQYLRQSFYFFRSKIIFISTNIPFLSFLFCKTTFFRQKMFSFA